MTKARKPARTAITRKGNVVEIGTLTEMDGGWFGYILDSKGYAVLICIPGPDRD